MSELPKILIIDDEKDLGEVLADYLEDDFSCTICSDPEEAVRHIKHEIFQLIISDLHMPVIDGMAIIGIVKDHQPDTPVVLLTGNAPYDPIVVAAMKKGASGVISKPFESPDDVITYLKSMI